MPSRKEKQGLPPGALIHVSDTKVETVKYSIIDYDEQHCEELTVKTVEECILYKRKKTVTWINVNGLESKAVSALGEAFEIHSLIMEDILTTDQRPKIEEFGNHIFLVFRMLYFDKTENVRSEQVSLIIGDNFLLSFQESAGDVFDPVRERIRKEKGKIRKMGPDYLAYCLLDAVVDGYFSILEELGEHLQKLDDALAKQPSQKTLQRINHLKRNTINFRRSVWPLRDVVSQMQRIESSLVKKNMRVYLKDLYDHTVQVMDSVESYRDMLSGMVDIYMSAVSNRMNEVMKVLTIISTLFIPLTFITGLYGMNFQYMPELAWKHGYAAVLILMLTVTAGLLYYFKRKGWL